jgi:hypothetical protein
MHRRLGDTWAFGKPYRPFMSPRKKFWVPLIAAMTVFSTVAMFGIAWADQVVNTIDSTVDSTPEVVTITAGTTTVVSFYIKTENDIPSGDLNGCNATGSAPATVTFSVPAGVTASATSLTFTGCGTENAKSITFGSTVPNAAGYSITVSAVTGGRSGSLWETAPAAFTLIVNPAPPSDTTPPVITPSVSGTLGDNGWYVSDVTVSWAVTDPESAISSTSGCDTTMITIDTTETTLTCTATSAGGTSSRSVTIKRDATPPTISASVSPDRPSTGWWNLASGAPRVTYTCSDATSGIAVCPGDYTFGEGENQSHTGTAVDEAGNSATDGVSDIDVDLTPPTLSWSNGPQDGESYYFGFVPAAPTCTASDSLSGPDFCTVNGYGNTVGSHTMTATAYDVAGNSHEEERSYTVLAWTLYGFYRPVDMGGVVNVVKGGSTVPLKFEIFAGPMELTDTAYVKSFKQAKINCDGTMPTDEIEVTTTGGTSLRYDWVAGQFIQNWQTPKQPGACYRVTMETQDESTLVALFKLK